MSVLMTLALAASGAVALPAPSGDPAKWLKVEDIPEDAFNSGQDGGFVYKALVTPAGKVEQCQVLAASTAKASWTMVCKRIASRGAFAPARDEKGAPAYSVLEDSYAYVLPELWVPGAMKAAPNFVFDVAKLPGGGAEPLRVAVNVAVDASGALRQCDAPAGAKQAALSRAACAQLPQVWQALPERNEAGQPVAYVRAMQVEFRQAPAR